MICQRTVGESLEPGKLYSMECPLGPGIEKAKYRTHLIERLLIDAGRRDRARFYNKVWLELIFIIF